MTHHVAPPLSTPSAQLPPTAQRITPPRTPAAGATARLVALPQLDGRLPHDPSAVDGYLASMQRARQVQLDALPTRPSCLVATAHRRTVSLILEPIRDARARVRAGVYGLCTRCGTRIVEHVLERQPWQPACPGCTAPDHAH